MKNSAAIASSYSDESIITADKDNFELAWQSFNRDKEFADPKGRFAEVIPGEKDPLYADSEVQKTLLASEKDGAGLIRVADGLHKNAEYLCQQLDMVMVGSGIDCDLVLADPQIARHHCLIALGPDGYLVRALDDTVDVLGRTLNPGDQEKVDGGAILSLGNVSIELSSGLPEELPASSVQRNLKLHVLLLSVVLALITGLWLGGSKLYSRETVEARDEMRTIESLPMPSAGMPAIESSARDLANQVGEILRLSGIQGKTSNLGLGKVEVVGVFPDNNKLERVIHSRAMQDIKGLQQVVVRNLREEKEEAPKRTDDKEIARVITGHDPYVVTRDEARYYPGAELVDGKTIEEITPDGVVVMTNEGDKQLLEPGTMLY